MKIFKNLSIFTFIFIATTVDISSKIKNNILVKVGDQIITSFELENKIKTTLLLTNSEINQNNINSLKGSALKALIDLKLKKDELKKFKIQDNQIAVQEHLSKIAIRLGVRREDLKNLFSEINVDYVLYLDEVKTEFLWQKLIFKIYSRNIVINESEIKNELDVLIKKNTNMEIQEFRLSEIEIILNSETEKSKKTEEVYTSIKDSGFANTATNMSTSSSAINGGDLGWISAPSLSKKFLDAVQNLKVGEISKPIFEANRFLLFKLEDKRVDLKTSDLDKESLEKSLINKKRNELLNLYSSNHLSKKRNLTLIEFK